MDFKADPVRVKANLLKSIASICNQREVSQLEEVLTSGSLLNLKGVALTENQKLALKIGF